MPQSPGLVLAVLIALVATQVTRVVLPDRAGPYLVTLALSAAGVVAGELVAGFGRFAGPSIGVLHPFLDLPAIAALQAIGVLVSGPARGTPPGE